MNKQILKNGKVSGVGGVIKKNKENNESEEFKIDTEDSKKSDSEESDPKAVQVQTELSSSDKEEFNDKSCQDARVDESSEGGITSSRTTGPTGMSGIDSSKKEEKKGKYQLTGFNINYTEKGSSDIISESVNDYYEDLDSAMNSIKDDIYMKKMPDGSYVKSSISSGSPIICDEEVQKRQYIYGEWKR